MTCKLGKLDLSDLDNVSVTAYRIISIINMLMKSPCNDVEINEKLQSDIIGARSLSQDTICIYINTLRSLGCIISRPKKNNNYRYELKYHPFKLNLKEEEISCFLEIKKSISYIDDWKQSVNLDELLNIMLENVSSEDKKTFLQIKKTYIREIELTYQTNLVNLLDKYCHKKRTLKIIYKSPESGEKLMEITVDKLTYENGAIYLWGYNTVLDEAQYLRVDRIKEIQAVNLRNTEYKTEQVTTKYKLTGISALMFVPSKNDSVKKSNNNEIFVDTKIENKFKFIQKILSYGSDCTLLSPDSIRNELVQKLKNMNNAYENYSEV